MIEIIGLIVVFTQYNGTTMRITILTLVGIVLDFTVVLFELYN